MVIALTAGVRLHIAHLCGSSTLASLLFVLEPFQLSQLALHLLALTGPVSQPLIRIDMPQASAAQVSVGVKVVCGRCSACSPQEGSEASLATPQAVADCQHVLVLSSKLCQGAAAVCLKDRASVLDIGVQQELTLSLQSMLGSGAITTTSGRHWPAGCCGRASPHLPVAQQLGHGGLWRGL